MQMADKLKSFSRRDGKTLMEEQARGVLNTLLLVMPPSTTKVRGVKAKKRGEAAIASDVRSVFSGSTPKRAEVSSMGEGAFVKRQGVQNATCADRKPPRWSEIVAIEPRST